MQLPVRRLAEWPYTAAKLPPPPRQRPRGCEHAAMLVAADKRIDIRLMARQFTWFIYAFEPRSLMAGFGKDAPKRHFFFVTKPGKQLDVLDHILTILTLAPPSVFSVPCRSGQQDVCAWVSSFIACKAVRISSSLSPIRKTKVRRPGTRSGFSAVMGFNFSTRAAIFPADVPGPTLMPTGFATIEAICAWMPSGSFVDCQARPYGRPG